MAHEALTLSEFWMKAFDKARSIELFVEFEMRGIFYIYIELRTYTIDIVLQIFPSQQKLITNFKASKIQIMICIIIMHKITNSKFKGTLFTIKTILYPIFTSHKDNEYLAR